MVRAADVLSAAIAENGRRALVAGHWRGCWHRYADEVHHGVLRHRRVCCRPTHAGATIFMERMALGRRGAIATDFSAQPGMAGAASLHFAGVSEAHSRSGREPG